MQYQWIVVALVAACLAAWSSARFSERVALEEIPFVVRIRLYIPFVPWRDRVDESIHPALESIRSRINLGAGALTITILVAAYLTIRAGSNSLNDPDPSISVPVGLSTETARKTVPMITPIEVISESPDSETTVEPPSAIALDLDPEELKELRTSTSLYGTAKVKPVYRLHDVEGALITNVDARSFWALLGVRNGDVVIELNGQAIDNPAVLVALMNALERDEDVGLAVRGKDGEVRYLEYRDNRASER